MEHMYYVPSLLNRCITCSNLSNRWDQLDLETVTRISIKSAFHSTSNSWSIAAEIYFYLAWSLRWFKFPYANILLIQTRKQLLLKIEGLSYNFYYDAWKYMVRGKLVVEIIDIKNVFFSVRASNIWSLSIV